MSFEYIFMEKYAKISQLPLLVWSTNYVDNLHIVLHVHVFVLFPAVEDIVSATLFLLSDQSSMVNGIVLPVEGGILTGVWKRRLRYKD